MEALVALLLVNLNVSPPQKKNVLPVSLNQKPVSQNANLVLHVNALLLNLNLYGFIHNASQPSHVIVPLAKQNQYAFILNVSHANHVSVLLANQSQSVVCLNAFQLSHANAPQLNLRLNLASQHVKNLCASVLQLSQHGSLANLLVRQNVSLNQLVSQRANKFKSVVRRLFF